MFRPDKTEAQFEAETALGDAIAAYNAAFTDPEDEIQNSIVTEWVVVFTARGFSEDGRDGFRDVSAPGPTCTPTGMVGLLQTGLWDAQAQRQTFVIDDGRDEE